MSPRQEVVNEDSIWRLLRTGYSPPDAGCGGSYPPSLRSSWSHGGPTVTSWLRRAVLEQPIRAITYSEYMIDLNWTINTQTLPLDLLHHQAHRRHPSLLRVRPLCQTRPQVPRIRLR